MTYDPIANTYHDPAPPCPFCGKPPRIPAITPAVYIECSGCWLRVPAGKWHDVALMNTSGADARRARDWALAAMHGAHNTLTAVARELARDLARLEAER